MVTPIETALTVLKLFTVALGGMFLWYAGRAYLKTRSRQMLVLVAAVVLLTFSAIVEGLGYQLLNLGRDEGHVVEAGFTLAAFAVLVASLFVRHRGGGKV